MNEPHVASAVAPVLLVEDLRVAFPNRDGGYVEAVRGVSFQLGRERLGIVGESGSGKSQTGRAILGLTAPEGRVTAQRLQFHGTDLLHCSPRQLFKRLMHILRFLYMFGCMRVSPSLVRNSTTGGECG